MALTDAYEVISSSINYASRIQRSILPDEQLFQEIFSDYFVHWEPRDVVGGDIYWCNRWGEGAVFMLGDCTGHGWHIKWAELLHRCAASECLSPRTVESQTRVGRFGVYTQAGKC